MMNISSEGNFRFSVQVYCYEAAEFINMVLFGCYSNAKIHNSSKNIQFFTDTSAEGTDDPPGGVRHHPVPRLSHCGEYRPAHRQGHVPVRNPHPRRYTWRHLGWRTDQSTGKNMGPNKITSVFVNVRTFVRYIKNREWWFCKRNVSPETNDFSLVVSLRYGCQGALMKSARRSRCTGPTWGPPGTCRPQVGPMLAPWNLLSGCVYPIFKWGADTWKEW